MRRKREKGFTLILSLFLSNLCFSAEAELNKKNLALVFGQFKYFNSERNLLIARMLVEPASLQEAIEKDSRRYEGLKKIEMDVLRNNEIIGSTSYFFEFDEDLFVVKNYTNFKVELFGITVFQY